MENLPIELLYEIAKIDLETYRGLLVVDYFAKLLTPSIITDFKIRFGFTVIIKNKVLFWKKDGKYHITDPFLTL